MKLINIKDNSKESWVEWNFLKNKQNWHLFNEMNWIMNWIMKSFKLLHRFFQDWDDLYCYIQIMMMYLDKVMMFLKWIFLLMHITEDQFSRASKILQIKYHNIMQSEYHNIFIKNDFISIMMIYHKSYSMNKMIKIIYQNFYFMRWMN